MEKVILITVLFCITFSSNFLHANGVYVEDGKNVELEEDNKNKRNRSIVQVPVSCFYEDGILSFTFHEDLGCVTIRITNLSAGLQLSETINSSMFHVELQIGSASGLYNIEVETSEGFYYGNLVVQ